MLTASGRCDLGSDGRYTFGIILGSRVADVNSATATVAHRQVRRDPNVVGIGGIQTSPVAAHQIRLGCRRRRRGQFPPPRRTAGFRSSGVDRRFNRWPARSRDGAWYWNRLFSLDLDVSASAGNRIAQTECARVLVFRIHKENTLVWVSRGVAVMVVLVGRRRRLAVPERHGPAGSPPGPPVRPDAPRANGSVAH